MKKRILAGFITLGLAAAGFLNSPAQAAQPGWITSCAYTHTLADDPIVFPGQPGVSHLHDFLGARSTNAFSTFDSLRAGGTACATQGDFSGYWVPALTSARDGVVVPSAGQDRDGLFYYRKVVSQTIHPFPDGFKMILGNSHATSASTNPGFAGGHIYFKCGPGGGTHLATPPTSCGSGSFLVLVFTFPNCDAVNPDGSPVIDSADHISHLSYPAGSVCPAAHPYALPRIQAFIRYSRETGTFGAISLASGPYYTAHADFFNAWDPVLFGRLAARCLNGGTDCGVNPTP